MTGRLGGSCMCEARCGLSFEGNAVCCCACRRAADAPNAHCWPWPCAPALHSLARIPLPTHPMSAWTKAQEGGK